jgi:hypothetical protein
MDIKFKIQTLTLHGWADLKVSSDDGKTYEDDWYETRFEAQAEIDEIVKHTDAWQSEYQVVEADTPEEFNIYES